MDDHDSSNMDSILMPPPSVLHVPKKRPRSRTIYSEQEAYSSESERILPTPGTTTVHVTANGTGTVMKSTANSIGSSSFLIPRTFLTTSSNASSYDSPSFSSSESDRYVRKVSGTSINKTRKFLESGEKTSPTSSIRVTLPTIPENEETQVGAKVAVEAIPLLLSQPKDNHIVKQSKLSRQRNSSIVDPAVVAYPSRLECIMDPTKVKFLHLNHWEEHDPRPSNVPFHPYTNEARNDSESCQDEQCGLVSLNQSQGNEYDVDVNETQEDAHDNEQAIVRKQEEMNGHAHASNEHDYDAPTIKTRFTDIIGHCSAKLRLEEMILPLALPPSLVQSVLTGIRSVPASILLYGPPGCGKTQLAKAVAGEAQAAFISVGPSDILSKFVGESEESIRELFQTARKKAMRMQSQCAVLFFDEIDALGLTRSTHSNGTERGGISGGETSSRRILAELLIQLSKSYNQDYDEDDNHDSALGKETVMLCDQYDLEGNRRYWTEDLGTTKYPCDTMENSTQKDETYSMTCKSNSEPHSFLRVISPTPSDETSQKDIGQRKYPRVIIIAATNRPEDCDPALLRRFSIRVLVGLPNNRDREHIFNRLLQGIHHTLTKKDIVTVATATEGWSGSDLESLTREAVMTPVRECLRSAAKLKANLRKQIQSSGIDTRHTLYSNDDLHGDAAARDLLLSGFRNLRAVKFQDFENAMSFWLGEDNSQQGFLGRSKGTRRRVHYDSDSSCDDYYTS